MLTFRIHGKITSGGEDMHFLKWDKGEKQLYLDDCAQENKFLAADENRVFYPLWMI